ncbi:MAG: hypothetical protein FalmKO_26530 [Falsiruegeria mediterranea]
MRMCARICGRNIPNTPGPKTPPKRTPPCAPNDVSDPLLPKHVRLNATAARHRRAAGPNGRACIFDACPDGRERYGRKLGKPIPVA